MKKYTNLLTYVSFEKSDELRELLFDCIALYSTFKGDSHCAALLHQEVQSMYKFGEMLVNGGEDMFVAADEAQHGSQEAILRFQRGKCWPEDWGMDSSQYSLFKKICNEMKCTPVRVAVAIMDFNWQLQKESEQANRTTADCHEEQLER